MSDEDLDRNENLDHNESFYIRRLLDWARECGVTVHPHCHDLPHSGGVYRSETREIFINVVKARSALFTVAHEVGHWLGYTCFGAKKHSYQRERQAFVYGWRALQLVGATHLISREEWIQNHRADTAHQKATPEDTARVHEALRAYRRES